MSEEQRRSPGNKGYSKYHYAKILKVKYLELLSNWETALKTHAEHANILSVYNDGKTPAYMTLRKWRQEFDYKKIRGSLDAQKPEAETSVDLALYKKALKGDTAAINLYYQKCLGWSPKMVQLDKTEAVKKREDFDKTEKEIDKLLGEINRGKSPATESVIGQTQEAGDGDRPSK